MLEITESAASRNQGAALENLARLRMRGFDLSIDDFGTGYSSLAKLVRTPFSELKIDREFVIKLTTDPAARTLVESIIAIARRLGLRTVAEGIETEAQHEILLGLNCDMGQGYLFAKPMPAAEWLQWMQGKRDSRARRARARPAGAGGAPGTNSGNLSLIGIPFERPRNGNGLGARRRRARADRRHREGRRESRQEPVTAGAERDALPGLR